MVLRAPREIVAGDVPQPRVDANQVVVRVTHSGICGTDYKIYSGAIPVSYPRVMGHEMTGHVVEAGGMSALKPGERVIVEGVQKVHPGQVVTVTDLAPGRDG